LSWFASAHPDGLEWAISGVTGKEELDAPENGIVATLKHWQEQTAFLPDYAFKAPEPPAGAEQTEAPTAWPAVDPGTSVSGLVGGGLTLLIALGLGMILKRKKKETPAS
jgi:cobalt/nickel transport system permease protein